MTDRIIDIRQAIKEAIYEEMKRDPSVIFMGQDVSFQVQNMLPEFGTERIIDTPFNEAGEVGVAMGAAIGGLRPIVDLHFFDFVTLAMDLIVNHIAKYHYMSGGRTSIPLVIRVSNHVLRGAGASQSQSLEAWFAHIPGLITIMPSTPYDAKGLLKSAIRNNNPVIFIDHINLNNTKGHVPEGEYLVPIGKADIKRKGKDLTIVATQSQVINSLNAAEKLIHEGIDCEVIDPRTLVPLDMEVITNSIKKTHRLLVVNESTPTCGYAAEIMARACETAWEFLDAPIMRLTSENVPIPHSPALESLCIPNEESIIEKAREILNM